MVDTSFEIRHIVRSKKDEHTYLVLVISAKKEKIYVGDCEKLKPVLHNRIENMLRGLPEPVANCTESLRESPRNHEEKGGEQWCWQKSRHQEAQDK